MIYSVWGYLCIRKPDEYELYLTTEDVKHMGPKARNPQMNGICKRLHQTIRKSFCAIAFRNRICLLGGVLV